MQDYSPSPVLVAAKEEPQKKYLSHDVASGSDNAMQ